jgi:hypothetical protein
LELFDPLTAPDSFFYVFGLPNEPRDFVGLHQLPRVQECGEGDEWDDKYSTDHYNMVMEHYKYVIE